MVLDEFAGLKRMEAIEKGVAQLAGFGVKLFFVLQSLEQLKGTYPGHWETFLANAGLKIFFSIEDHFTRDYVSKLVGETEVIREMRSENESRAENQSRSDGSSRNETLSKSKNHGTSSSQSDTTSQNTGMSDSHSFNASSGENEGSGSSFGSSGYSFNSSSGSNVSSSSGNTSGFSSGSGRSFTDGTGKSYSETLGSSEGSGTSQTTTEGSSRTTGKGRNETVHRRALIQPDEVGRFFARCDDKSSPLYPGIALVMVTGANPLMVRRTHYFEDLQFIDCFSPHPDHKFIEPVEYSPWGVGLLKKEIEAANDGHALTISKWFIKTGHLVRQDQAAFQIDHVPPDDRTVLIYIPYSAKVTYTTEWSENLLPSGEYTMPLFPPIFGIKTYPDEAEKSSGLDPERELREAHQDFAKYLNEKRAAREMEEVLRENAKVRHRVILVIFVLVLLLAFAALAWHLW